MKTLCVVESPYAGDVEGNLRYARQACRDSVRRGERPFASHLFYTQFMDDTNRDERRSGIELGYDFWQQYNCKIVFYCDLGWSSGMIGAFERIAERWQHIDFRMRFLGPHILNLPTFSERATQFLFDNPFQMECP